MQENGRNLKIRTEETSLAEVMIQPKSPEVNGGVSAGL